MIPAIAPRVLSLSPGTIVAAGPAATVDYAADAGFTHVGLRFDPDEPADTVAKATNRLAARNMTLFDVEVIRLGVTPTTHAHRLVNIAAELGASWIVVTSHLPTPAETLRALRDLVTRCENERPGLLLGFEAMGFTEVKTVYDAASLVREAGAGLIFDPLHMYRTGHGPVDAERVLGNGSLPCYLQLCDTLRPRVTAQPMGEDELIAEARHGRHLPGTGILQLAEFVAAMPAHTSVTAEVQSDVLYAELGPGELARRCFTTSQGVLRR